MLPKTLFSLWQLIKQIYFNQKKKRFNSLKLRKNKKVNNLPNQLMPHSTKQVQNRRKPYNNYSTNQFRVQFQLYKKVRYQHINQTLKVHQSYQKAAQWAIKILDSVESVAKIELFYLFYYKLIFYTVKIIFFLFNSVRNHIVCCYSLIIYFLLMDIQFIEQKYRDDVFKLMELCGLQMAEAYQLLTRANYNFEGAMNMHFNGGPSQNNQQFKPYPQPTYNQNFGGNYGNYGQDDNFQNNPDLDEFDILYEKYKIYKQGGKRFQSRYELRRQSGLIGGFIAKIWKNNQQSHYKKTLEQYFGKPCAINFATGSLSNLLATSDKFPVIVYLLDFSPGAKSKVQQTLRNHQFMQIVNVQFKNFGVDKTYDMEKSLVKFVDPKKINNSLLILRVIQTISLINSTYKEIMQKLKLAKNLCISKDLDDGHLQKRLIQQLNGNFDYQKPMSITQRRKVAQDRQIRRKQQEQFYASMKSQQQKQIKAPTTTNQKPSTTSNTNINNSKPSYTKIEQKKQPPKRNIAEQRKLIRDRLKIYTSGMNIKLRLPNGQAVILVVDPQQKGKYLYDYVQGIENDIGFQKDQDRKFDIIRPYDKLNMSQKLNQTLNEIFEGSDSQNLVVSEKE